uniref:Nose resistant-to-fluoxetine protein N-terminal domain-containing protein n=1 Tax=Stomoxys calcitrans TaxID=35570 RepID=A0A1I8QBL2_STOCA
MRWWWNIILVNLTLRTVCCNKSANSMDRDQQRLVLARQNFLVGIASLAAVHETINTRCGQELEMLLQAVEDREVWAMKVVDNFGTIPKSFTWGNYFWFGAPDLCDDLNKANFLNLAHSRPIIINATSPMSMALMVVYMNYTTPYDVDVKLPFENLIHVGLCLPESCNATRIRQVADTYFQQHSFIAQQHFDLEMKSVEVKTLHFSPSHYFSYIGSVLYMFIVFFSFSMPAIVKAIQSNKQTTKKQLPSSLGQKVEKLSGELRCEQQQQQRVFDHNQSSVWRQLLECFNITANYETFTSLENSNRNSVFLSAMAGLRSIICMWITVFHVYYYSVFALSNAPYLFTRLEKFVFQPVVQACFYVDVFFVMSSFLLVFNFLSNDKHLRKIAVSSWWESIKMFLNSVMQRYMRLTPVMIVIMLMTTTLSNFLNMYSPFRMAEHSGYHCANNWWYNMLYIQNFLDMNTICGSWTWYLACDMQYFVLFTALLYVHAKQPTAGKIIFVIFAIGSVVIGWISYYISGITFETDVIYSTLNEVYVKPWVRIPPYIGGSIMGWVMYKMQQKRSQTVGHQEHHQSWLHSPNRAMRKIFWMFCFVIYISTNFMSYWRSTPTWAVATIMSVGKIIFALCAGGVIIECSRERGGLFNRLLSARPFLFLNKFCYSIYMVAPIIVGAMFGLRREPTNFTEVGSSCDFIAITVLSIVSGMLLYILVELPWQRVSNILLKPKT